MPKGITGVVGIIRWQHYTAAAINGYTVTPTDKAGARWALRATVVLANAFNLAQRPLTFVAKHKRGEWRWPIESMEVRTLSGVPTLTATLGREETTPDHVPIRPT